jgi:hypothetical protein
MEVVQRTIGRRRQSSADGQKSIFGVSILQHWGEKVDLWNLMPLPAHL